MNRPSPSPDDPARVDPESLLGARLRATRPELEARFDALVQALDRQPSRAGWRAWLPNGGSPRLGWSLAGVFAALALVAGFLLVRSPAGRAPAADFDPAAYGELLALSEALAPALPLADPDVRAAVIEMPLPPQS